MTPSEVQTFRAKELHDARLRLDHLQNAKREALAGKPSWVVYTGTEDCPVWINEDDVRAGRYSLSLSRATRYRLEAAAERFAAIVQNGKGQRGVAIELHKAYDLEIARTIHFIKLIEDLIAMDTATS